MTEKLFEFLVYLSIIQGLTIIVLIFILRRKKMGPTLDLYVGNLPYSVKDEQELKRDLSNDVGQVNKAVIVRGRKSDRPHCYGFITVPEREACKFLDSPEVMYKGRKLRIRHAFNKQKRR